jgi:cytochrome b subunit of formate dehydrogenase
MTLGSVRRDWAEHHHAEWVAAMDDEAARKSSAEQ